MIPQICSIIETVCWIFRAKLPKLLENLLYHRDALRYF